MELLTGLLSAMLICRWDGVPALFALSALYFMGLHSLTDLRSGYIYDCVALACGLWGLALRGLFGFPPLWDGILGAAAGAAPVIAVILASRGGMGWGDASLMAGLGTLLGWKITLVALYCGIILGGITAAALLGLGKIRRKDTLPLAPALAAGTAAALVWGPWLLSRLGTAVPWPWR